MKRAKSSANQVGRSTAHIQRFVPFIAFLPIEILINILLKLSTRSIILCKCVCKTWYNVISDPQFAKFHLEQARTYPLVRDNISCNISRTVYLIEPEDGRDLDSGYCWCKHANHKCGNKTLMVKSKLKIPLRNPQSLLDMFQNVGDLIKSHYVSY